MNLKIWRLIPPTGNMLAYFNAKLLHFVTSAEVTKLTFQKHSELVDTIKAKFTAAPELPPPPPRCISYDPKDKTEERAEAAKKRKYKKAMEAKVKTYREQLWNLEHGGFCPNPNPPLSSELLGYLKEHGLLDTATDLPLLEPLEPPRCRRRWMRG